MKFNSSKSKIMVKDTMINEVQGIINNIVYTICWNQNIYNVYNLIYKQTLSKTSK